MSCATKRKLQDEMTQHPTALEALALPPLSLKGCRAPAAAQALAPLLRQKACHGLLAKGVRVDVVEHGVCIPFVLNADDPLFIEALTTACRFHERASWWLAQQGNASVCLTNEIVFLCKMREKAIQSKE